MHGIILKRRTNQKFKNMKSIYLLIEDDKQADQGFIRGQTTDQQKGLKWAKGNARKSGSFASTKTGFQSKEKAFDVIDKNDLK